MENVIRKLCHTNPIIKKEDGRELFCALYNQHKDRHGFIRDSIANVWEKDGIPKKEVQSCNRSNKHLNTFSFEVYVSEKIEESIFSQSSYTFSKYDYDAIMLNYYRESEGGIRSLDIYLRYLTTEDRWCLLGFVENLLPEEPILRSIFTPNIIKIITKYV